MLNPFSDPEIQDIAVKGYQDTKYLANTIFPETFYLPFSSLHSKIIGAIDNPYYKYVVIAAPRGIGKTTLARLLGQKAIMYRDSKFIVYISESASSAEMQTENIKRELLANKKAQIFGKINVKSHVLDESFSKKSWVANNHTFVLPRGSGQQVRGLNWIRYRPDLFIIDDLEDKETINNESIRESRREWFYSDVMKAKPTGSDTNYKFVYIDTVKHEDSLVGELLNDPRWLSLRLSVCDDDYKTLAPEFMSQKELDDEIEYHRRNRIMDLFAMEFMSQPISREAAAFKSEYLKYYSETDEDFVSIIPRLENVVIIDPAKTANPANAQTGLVVWGIDMETGALYLREARGEYLHPDEIYGRAFELADRYNARVIGYEITGLNEFITHPFKNAMMQRGKNYELVELRARKGEQEFSGHQGGKVGRVASLIPYYRQGLIYHNRHNCGAYEKQILSFPKSKKWDIMDAAAYIIELLEKGERYFYPLAEGDETYMSEEYVEKEYAQLEEYDSMEEELSTDYFYMGN